MKPASTTPTAIEPNANSFHGCRFDDSAAVDGDSPVVVVAVVVPVSFSDDVSVVVVSGRGRFGAGCVGRGRGRHRRPRGCIRPSRIVGGLHDGKNDDDDREDSEYPRGGDGRRRAIPLNVGRVGWIRPTVVAVSHGASVTAGRCRTKCSQRQPGGWSIARTAPVSGPILLGRKALKPTCHVPAKQQRRPQSRAGRAPHSLSRQLKRRHAGRQPHPSTPVRRGRL